jgi:hypothetical protein
MSKCVSFQSQGREETSVLRKQEALRVRCVSACRFATGPPMPCTRRMTTAPTHVLKFYKDHTHSVSSTRFASVSAAGEQMSEHTASNPQKYRVCMFPVREHSRPCGLVADQLRNLW